MVKHLPAMWKTWVLSLGREDPLEKKMATHSSTLLPGKFHGLRSVVGYSPWSCKESDTTEQLRFSSFHFSSITQSCQTLCDPMDHSMPGFPVHHQLPEFTKHMSIESVMPSNYLILCHPLLLLPSTFHSIRVFSNESALRIR